ncbi:MAG TPA: hypothetical protein VJ720_11920 [Chitinophaga sp.]|nr:hypothetical protein [Chitinophaga sp.]
MANQLIQIKREKDRDTTLDYATLRARALTRIQELSGHVWTDYNLHDPGITILEQLCFAITDLAYKTDFPINEILAGPNGQINRNAHAFYSKAQMLCSGPVTADDFRKLVLDRVPGVENLWIEPVRSYYIPGAGEGVYRVYVQPQEAPGSNISQHSPEGEKLLQDVRSILIKHRNLGENFEEISILEPQPVYIRAAIMIDEQYPVKETLAHVFNAIEHVIYPPVRFLSEAELLDAGYTTEDIYSGPLLSGGFIPDGDLKPRRQLLDPSELVRSISQTTGVLQVKYLYLSSDGQQYDNRPIRIKDGYYPHIDISHAGNDIGIYSDQFEQHAKDAVFWAMYQKLREIRKRRFTGQQRGLADHSLQASYRDVTHYHSLQYFFPQIYNIGADGVSEHAPAERKAQAKQLKAYLLLFEQLLANYLSQLGGLDGFFSPEINVIPPQTYFFQALYEVPHVKDLLSAYTSGTQHWEAFMADKDNGYMNALRRAIEDDALYQQRKLRTLDHLLARFNLSLPRYAISLYERLYSEPGSSKRINTELQWKSIILQHLYYLLPERTQSYNYLDEVTKDISRGYHNWIHALLHIKPDNQYPLTTVFDQEHIDMQTTGAWHPVPTTRRIHAGGEVIWVTDEGGQTGGQYQFGHQPVSVLKLGIDPGNYRIIKDSAQDLYLVLYKTPAQHTWKTLSQHKTRQEAAVSQKEIIRHLQKLSMDSEGFYMVEHVLLKPSLKARAYGFRLMESANNILLEHQHFATYEEREEYIARLLQKDWAAIHPDDMYRELSAFCTIHQHGHSREEQMQHIAIHLEELRESGKAHYPRMEYVCRTAGDKVLPESFFRTSVTIVLPLWPARFQYTEFRKFTEEIFHEHSPAHYRLHFRWLGIADMKVFEDNYYSWLKELNSFFDPAYVSPAAERLVHFLSRNKQQP